MRISGDKSLFTHVRGTVVSSALLLRSNGMRKNESMEHQHGEDPEPRYGFGLTTLEVERLRRILARLEGHEVSLEDAWGRAAELLSLTHGLLELFASGSKEPGTVPGDLTDPAS